MAVARSPAARWGLGRQTSVQGVRLALPSIDWWWRFGRGGRRRVAATKQRRRGRGGSNGGEDRGRAQQCVARAASMCPREGARWVPGLGETAEGRAQQWWSGGGRGSSGSGEQADWLGQHVGVQARCGRGEGLDVLRRPWKWTGRWAHRGGINGGRRSSVAVCVRARQGGQAGFIPAGGRLGANGVTPVTHARVEKPRRAPLQRPMARHGRCAGRWIGATWRGPLATGVTGELPLSQRSDRWSLRHLGVRARRGYGTYGGLPTWPRATSRQSALRCSRAFSIRWYSFQTRFSLNFET
jgi:hypothetical protein